MREGIRLQNRDIELLIFLGRYKIISLDNTRYIYGTVTYQEKRIVNLVKHNYIRRLKHRYITLGTKGKGYLLENGFEVREHCRNENNIERLNVISDIASCLIHDNMNFIPSWNMKKEDEPTTHSRRYIGKLEYNNQDEFLVYAIYEGKDDKYIKSIYYDIRKEHEYKTVMIFTNNIEKIVLHEKGFFFGNNYTVLVPYNEYGKFLIRNNYEIRNSIYLRLKELYKVELTDFKFADLTINEQGQIIKEGNIIEVIQSERKDDEQENTKEKQVVEEYWNRVNSQQAKEYEQQQPEKIRPREESIRDTIGDEKDRQSKMQMQEVKTPTVDLWMNRFDSWYSAIDRVSQNVKAKFVKMKSDIVNAISNKIKERMNKRQVNTQGQDSSER